MICSFFMVRILKFAIDAGVEYKTVPNLRELFQDDGGLGSSFARLRWKTFRPESLCTWIKAAFASGSREKW